MEPYTAADVVGAKEMACFHHLLPDKTKISGRNTAKVARSQKVKLMCTAVLEQLVQVNEECHH